MGIFSKIKKVISGVANTVADVLKVAPHVVEVLGKFNDGPVPQDEQMLITNDCKRLVAIATQAGIPVPSNALQVPGTTEALAAWYLQNVDFWNSCESAAAAVHNNLADLVLKYNIDLSSDAQAAPIVTGAEDQATLEAIGSAIDAVHIPTLDNATMIAQLKESTPTVAVGDGAVNRALNLVGAGSTPSSFTKAPTAQYPGSSRFQDLDCGEVTLATDTIVAATPSILTRQVTTAGTTSFTQASNVVYGQTIVPQSAVAAAGPANILCTGYSNATVPLLADGMIPTREMDAGVVLSVVGGKYPDFLLGDPTYWQTASTTGYLPAVRATPSWSEAADRSLGELGFSSSTALPSCGWLVVPQTASGTATSMIAQGLDRNGQDTALTSTYNVTMKLRQRICVDESVFKDWTSIGSVSGDLSSVYELQVACTAYDPATNLIIPGTVRTKSFVRTAVLGRKNTFVLDFTMPYEHICLCARLCVPVLALSTSTRVNRRGWGGPPLCFLDTPQVTLRFATRANQLYAPTKVMACPTLAQLAPAIVTVDDMADIIACGAIDGEGVSRYNYLKAMDPAWQPEGFSKTAIAMHNTEIADGTMSKLDALRNWLAAELDDQLLLSQALTTLQGLFPFPEDREQVQHSPKWLCEFRAYLASITAADWTSTDPTKAATNAAWVQAMNYRYGAFFNKTALVTAIGFGGSALSEAAVLALPTSLFLYPAGQVRDILAQLRKKYDVILASLSLPNSDLSTTSIDLY